MTGQISIEQIFLWLFVIVSEFVTGGGLLACRVASIDHFTESR
jgi:hypothetical protein